MKRSSPLRRSPMTRKSAVRKRNASRKKARFESDFGGEDYVAFIKSLPCAICEVQGFSEAAHVVSRGAGGKASDLVPLCGIPRREYFGKAYTESPSCHRRFDLFRWTLPEGTEERLKIRASELWASRPMTPNRNEK